MRYEHAIGPGKPLTSFDIFDVFIRTEDYMRVSATNACGVFSCRDLQPFGWQHHYCNIGSEPFALGDSHLASAGQARWTSD